VSEAAAAPSRNPGHIVLAFDFGTRWIGVAVGDTETKLASPLGMLEVGAAARRMEEIQNLVREWKPARLLVGLPLSTDGQEHGMTKLARRFARQLEARFRLPVDFADERFSSLAAEAILRETGRGGRRHKQAAHALSARIILQSYFDETTRR
jgi:putative Holliday junction resolvase